MDFPTANIFWRSLLFFGSISLLSAIIGTWITYLLIKSAIRDGIKESGVIEALARTSRIETNGEYLSPLSTFEDTQPPRF